MDTQESTETVTVSPQDMYDELASETPPEFNDRLKAAAARAREVIVRK